MTCELTWPELQKQLRPASFGGVSFYVEATNDQFGHRVVTHEFPGSNTPYNESLGRAARKYSLNGYFSGSNWQHGRDALILAAESGAALTLRHPFYRTFILAKATNVSVDHSKETLGYVTFTLDVVEVLSTLTFSGVIGYIFQIRNLFKSLIGSVSSRHTATINDTSFEIVDRTVTDSGSAFAQGGGQLYIPTGRKGAGIRPFDDSLRIELIEMIESFASSLNEVRINLTFADDADLSVAITDLFGAATSILDGDDIEPFLTEIVTSFRDAVVGNIELSESASGDSVVDSNPTGTSTDSSFLNTGSASNFDALGEFSDKSIGYRAAADALEDLIWYGVDAFAIDPAYAVRGSLSATAQRLSELRQNMYQAFRITVGGLWAEMVVSADYGSSSEAVAARNLLVKWLDSERNLMLALGAEDYATFDEMAGLLTDRMTQKWAGARPIITETLAQLTSSVAKAYDIYDDPTLAVALWRRNGGYDPSSLGACIEYIAPDV